MQVDKAKMHAAIKQLYTAQEAGVYLCCGQTYLADLRAQHELYKPDVCQHRRVLWHRIHLDLICQVMMGSMSEDVALEEWTFQRSMLGRVKPPVPATYRRRGRKGKQAVSA